MGRRSARSTARRFSIASPRCSRAGQRAIRRRIETHRRCHFSGKSEVQKTIDRWLYYAGWADKYQQIFSSVNPVNSSHFNFSVLEPTGVVSIIAPENSGLIGLSLRHRPRDRRRQHRASRSHRTPSRSAPSRSRKFWRPAISPAASSTSSPANARSCSSISPATWTSTPCIYCGDEIDELTIIRTKSAANVKRVIDYDREDWLSDDAQSPYLILDTQEVKTTWHPIGA